MNILFTICGRAGSKGIKNKNIRHFCGYPLAYYYLAVIVLLVPADSFLFFGGTTPLLLLLLGNVVFVLYDIAFSRLIALYIFRLQKDFRRRLGL